MFPLYSGDYKHYYEKLLLFKQYGFTDLEFVYGYVISFVDLQYFLFRLIIWGSALCILRFLFKRFTPLNNLTLAFFVVWGILFYAYPRVSLALSIFFLGFSFFAKPVQNQCWGYLFGLILIIASTLFHKSIIELVILIPFSLIKLTKKRLLLYLMGVLICVFILNKYIFNISDVMQSLNGMEYFSMETYDYSIGKKIVNLSLQIPIILLIIIIIRKYVFDRKITIDASAIPFVSMITLIFLLSLMWMFCNIQSQVLFYRTLYMVFIPLAIVLAYLYKSLLHSTVIRFTLIYYISCNIWLLYCLLGQYNGSIQ